LVVAYFFGATLYTHCCHHHLLHQNTTLLDGEHIHCMQLHGHLTHLSDCDFILRMLYKNCYWHKLFYFTSIFRLAFCRSIR